MEQRHTGFRLDARLGYFRNEGVNVMAFDDIYPEGHQSGVGMNASFLHSESGRKPYFPG